MNVISDTQLIAVHGAVMGCERSLFETRVWEVQEQVCPHLEDEKLRGFIIRAQKESEQQML